MVVKTILSKAKAIYKKKSKLAYSKDFHLSPQWTFQSERMKEDIASLSTAEGAIHAGQDAARYKLNHRHFLTLGVKATIKTSLAELKQIFMYLPAIKDSSFSLPITVNEDGYSNIFTCWHLYFWLRINDLLKPLKILDIGGGMGELARIFKIENSKIDYTIVDTPESLFFAYNFLESEDISCNYVPIQELKKLEGKEFDLVLNVGSFQEMDSVTIDSYLNFIQTKIKTKYFYSMNYSHNTADKKQVLSNKDDKWKCKFYLTNPPVINRYPSAEGTTWVEVLYERMK